MSSKAYILIYFFMAVHITIHYEKVEQMYTWFSKYSLTSFMSHINKNSIQIDTALTQNDDYVE